MARIVISYRREDTIAVTGRIYDRLCRYYGKRDVFRDLDDIPPGPDFRQRIHEALRRAKVLVAIVGLQWLGPRDGAQARIMDADDPVRIEIETALQMGLQVIPVLVDGAAMPKREQLPASMEDFAFRNAIVVSQTSDFDDQLHRLNVHLKHLAFGRFAGLKFAMRQTGWRVAAGAAIAAISIGTWLAVADGGRLALRDMISGRAVGATDIEVAEFRLSHANSELEHIRYRTERHFVDLFTDANLRVRATLTTNQTLARSHFTLNGRISELPSDRIDIAVELRDAGGRIVGTSRIEAAKAELEDIYRVIPEALMFGMEVYVPTLTRDRRASRPTNSTEAYAQFLAARRQVHARRFAEAERHLHRGIEIAPDFAMGYWAIGEVKRLMGQPEEAAKWHQQASGIHFDHPRQSIQPGTDARPVPALLSQAKQTEAREVHPGATYKLVKLTPYDLDLHVWAFDTARHHLKVVQQSTTQGEAIESFLQAPNDVLATNGGFFDIDSQSRLSPSGLLVVGGAMVRDVSTQGGSGVIFATDSAVGIVFRQALARDRIVSAVQSGPLLVDPGGKFGVRRNDFDRQNRTAVCLRAKTIVVVVLDGGLSLYEFAEVLTASQADGGMGCDVALNMDGGPSTQAIFRSAKESVTIPGRWRLHNALVIYRRE